MNFEKSQDNTSIAYESYGQGNTLVLFVHGWLGSKRWWDNQKDFLKNDYQVVQMDLGGHGDSEKNRKEYTAKLYAEDIVAVANKFSDKKIILVGHSMSGVYVTMASLKISNVIGIVLIDTLKDLDFKFSDEQVSQMMQIYRHNFEYGLKNIFPQYLFSPATPLSIQTTLMNEFLAQKDFAADAIEALYKTDVREFASLVKVPVRAINSEIPPTNKQVNLNYFKDFDFMPILNVGHYPMLEKPQELNDGLAWAIKEINK